MGKKITIRIDKNGMVESHISGAPGRKCLNDLELLEELVAGKIILHELTEEYYQNNEISVQQNNTEQLKSNL